VRHLVDYMASCGVRGEPGLDDAALGELERALDARLPEQVRQLYRLCGGVRDTVWRHRSPPMRLLPPDEAVDVLATLRECADTYPPSPEARYLFTDDGSNWAGVFVEGPLIGKLTLLDHDETSRAPRFRDTRSFAVRLAEAGRAELSWSKMPTDYPLAAACEPALAAEALPLAIAYLDDYRAAVEVDDALLAAEVAVHLLPPTEWAALRELLSSPHQFVRYLAVGVAGHQKQRRLVPDLVAIARAARDADNYGHWSAAVKALVAINAEAEVDTLVAAADPRWPIWPIRRARGS